MLEMPERKSKILVLQKYTFIPIARRPLILRLTKLVSSIKGKIKPTHSGKKHKARNIRVNLQEVLISTYQTVDVHFPPSSTLVRSWSKYDSLVFNSNNTSNSSKKNSATEPSPKPSTPQRYFPIARIVSLDF